MLPNVVSSFASLFRERDAPAIADRLLHCLALTHCGRGNLILAALAAGVLLGTLLGCRCGSLGPTSWVAWRSHCGGSNRLTGHVTIGKNNGVVYNIARSPRDHLRFSDGSVPGADALAFNIAALVTFWINCRGASVAYPPQIPVCCLAWDDCTEGRRVCRCGHWECHLHSRRQYTNDAHSIAIIVCRHCPLCDTGAMHDPCGLADWPIEGTRKTLWCHRHSGRTGTADGGEWSLGQRDAVGGYFVSPNLEGQAAARDTGEAFTLVEQMETQDECQPLREERISSKE